MSHEVVDVIEQPVIVVDVAEAVGARGPKGDPGRDGVDGLDGAPGKDGAPGRDGLPGADGRDGTDGLSAYELAVAAGFVGTEVVWLASLVGPAGTDGADGRDGVDGAPGPAGERGPAGADGAPGPVGERGPAGERGADGAPGLPGERGPAGVDGAPGERGPAGADGAPGPKGDPGPPGRDGIDGAPGAPGQDGAPGRDGADGAPGAKGDKGDPGPGLAPGGMPGQVPVKASAADYDVTWQDPASGGGGWARQTKTIVTGPLASGATATGTVELAGSYRALRVTTDVPARVRLYTNAAKRDQDLARPVGVKPSGDHGRMLEVVTTTALPALDLSPTLDGFVEDGTQEVPFSVTSTSPSGGAVTVTLIWIRTE